MIVHGVHGIAVLGLATEVNKLSMVERRTLMEWVAEDVGGRVPLSVTVSEPSVNSQADFLKAAADAGANWGILQPPAVKGVPESELIRFFGSVADKSSIPIAIQNAPQYLGVGLSNSSLKLLHEAHPQVRIVKLEATAIAIDSLMNDVHGELDIFNGRGGIEITDCLRAGAVGIIPGGESFDLLTDIYNCMSKGATEDIEKAEALYSKVLPLLEFLMQSMDTFLVYGKAVLGHRLRIDEVKPRIPHTPATIFGLKLAQRYAEQLGRL
jgi:2-keto-3-deoxy-L-arabinonate dehydratase